MLNLEALFPPELMTLMILDVTRPNILSFTTSLD